MNALPNLPNQPDEPPSDNYDPSVPLWRRIVFWTTALLTVLIAMVVIGSVALLHSQRFHDYVLTKAQQSASDSLGVPVELQNYSLHFSGISPTLDLYGLVIHGAAPYANPPLLQVERARIGVRIVSVLRQAWYLNEFTLHHAVAQIRVDAQGNNNLPRPSQSSPNANPVQPLFDLAIRHAALDQGEIYYNDRKSALDADVRDVTLSAGFNSARNLYIGQLAYSDGHLRTAGYQPISHALQAEFEMTPTHLDIRNASLRSGNSSLAFSATLDDFSNPRISTIYRASLDATELRRLLRNANLPLGVVLLDGRAEYAALPNQPPLNAIAARGTLRSDRLEFIAGNASQPLRTEARAIHATYSLSNGNAEVRSLAASLLGGTLDADATVLNLTGEQQGAAHLKLNGISLAALKQTANVAAANDVTLQGTLNASGEASWKGSPQNLLATADATLNAAAGSTQSASTIPISGEIHASFRNRDQQLTLRQSSLRTPQTTIMLDGTTGQHSQMNLALNAQDLHEMETIAAIFTKPAQPLGLRGSATFAGTLSGPTSAPSLSGDLNGANLRARGTAWKSLKAHVSAGPDSVEIQGGDLVPASTAGSPQGNIAFAVHAQLKKWSFSTSSPFELSLNAQNLDASQLAHIAGSATPVSGTLNVNMQAHGTTLNPIGQGHLDLTKASVSGEPIQSLLVQFNGDGTAVHANLNLTMTSGVTTGVVTYYPKQRGYEVQLEARNFKLDQLQTVKGHNLQIAGVMNLVANGHGTLDDPQLTASLEIPQLSAQGQTIEHLALQANVAQHVANISVDTRAVNSNIRGKATVQLSGNYMAEAVLDTQPIPLQPLVATYAPSQAGDISGQTELHATLRGPLRQRERLEAHVVIPELSLRYQQSIDIGATGPIHADYVNGVLTLQRSGLKGTGTDLQFQGSLPLLDRTKPVALLLLGSVDLRLAQLFDPDLTSSGQVRFNINSYGERTDPSFQGDVQIVNANILVEDAPLGLSNGNGTLTLTRDRLNITSFEGTVGGGKLTARGSMVYHPALQFDVALAGQGIRMLYPDGVREGLSANLTLTGTPERATLRGQVNVDQLSFTPDFDLSTITSFGNGVQEPPSQGFVSNLQLNIALRSSQNLNLVSRTLSANGAANLRVTGTAAQPVILGRVALTGGDLVFQGNRYVLQSGVIDFVNPTRTDPNINASVTTTIQQYNIGMRFEGTPEHLHTTYTSDPTLPPADIINLLAFGKTQEAANANASSTSNTLTAEQSIASAVSSQVTSRLETFTGISHLSVDPTLGNNQQTPATITVQQRVTGKIFVTFSTDVTSTERQVIQLQYQATPQVSLSGTRDQNGGFGFDTRITREW